MLLHIAAAVTFSLLGALQFVPGFRRRHRAWMKRGYPIGQGAGRQAVLLSTWALAVGPTTELSRAVLMGASWTLNLLVAEWLIRRRHPAATTASRPTTPAAAG
ncbi:Predicted membrane protein (DUF2306) [Micromonospora matsumotoense]|uniref:Predicted membrane protein (DUF2306) n=1 Tax=Micromonospora matsumotoense TaxID=121616 RepID=A0A1C5AP33_9ACTN|nr:DUF2306 domain-containing protein [Micromonospora matsumotoense]SCF46988.1 Predicted membrane protein (DUF2306) [Micromonospora matsumotoense]